MTRKDYVLIAAVINEVYKNTVHTVDAIEEVVDQLCIDLYRENPRFDEATFRKVCYRP